MKNNVAKGTNLPSLFLLPMMLIWGAGQLPAQHHGQHDHRALHEDPRLAPGQIAPVLVGLGTHHHSVTTNSERAQLFFDQGLKLTYGFNHQEALRAFKETVRLDPNCAMGYWGWALVLGPNLNLPMQASVVPQAWEAIQTALRHIDKVTEKEADYIRALALRYSNDPKAERAPLDAAYAAAMGKLHLKYPDDTDAATLYAAALMNLTPWNYWTKDGQPRKRTPEITAVLEKAIEQDPRHEGALHYYIHAVEAADARRGEPAADRLRGLAPGAGHLVHMPSHIYMQTGRYAEAFEVNVLASQADEGYITQCRAQGIYPLNYYPHNLHFLSWASMMLGRSRITLETARKVASKVPDDFRGDNWALYQTFLSMPLYTMVRFGMWDQILAEPQPSEKLRYLRGISHYARGLAYTHTNRPQAAEQELAALRGITKDPTTPEVLIGYSNAHKLLRISLNILEGELAARKREYPAALEHLRKAVQLQDDLHYTEPPDWYYPVRHTLGAVLLEAGHPEEAENVYRHNLKKYPENGFALYGLWQSLMAQGNDAEAARTKKRFEAAWKLADLRLSTSRF